MILITGGTGFLGRHIVDEVLASGKQVRLLLRNPGKLAAHLHGKVEVVQGDLQDIASIGAAMEGVSKVIHAAAQVSFRKKDREEVLNNNVKGTTHLINACLEAEIARFVHVSSIATNGRAPKGEMITEKTARQPGQEASTYAKSKIKSEKEVFRGASEGLDVVVVNPGLIIGPAENWTAGTPQIFQAVASGLPFYQAGSNGLVGAADVARACHLLLDAEGVSEERYILVAENWTYLDFLTEVARNLHVKPPFIRAPRGLMYIAGWLSEMIADLRGKEGGLTTETVRGGSGHFTYDGSKITALGFRYTPIREVIAETAQAFLKSRSA